MIDKKWNHKLGKSKRELGIITSPLAASLPKLESKITRLQKNLDREKKNSSLRIGLIEDERMKKAAEHRAKINQRIIENAIKMTSKLIKIAQMKSFAKR